MSGPGARAWLFALADRAAVQVWLRAQPDPIALEVSYSPGQDLLVRYLVSLLAETQHDPPQNVPTWDRLAWVAPFCRRVDDHVEASRATDRHAMAPSDLAGLIDQAAEAARLWRIFVFPDTRPGDVEYRDAFQLVAPLIERRPNEVARALRARRDLAQSLLDVVLAGAPGDEAAPRVG